MSRIHPYAKVSAVTAQVGSVERAHRPYQLHHHQHVIQPIPELKQFLEGIKPRLLLRNLPQECSQSELVALFPVKPLDIVAIEFLTKNEKTQKAGAAVVELSTFESLDKAAEIDGREMGGMVIWATKDKDGIRTLSYLNSIGHRLNQRRIKHQEQAPPPVVAQPDLAMVLKLAANIDMSQLAQLREAVESAQSVATQVDDYKHRSVKVRNLPRSASQAQIQQIFNGCGTIEHITPQNQRGEVVIRYTTPDEADLAVRFYNGRKMDGKKLHVLYRAR